MPKRSILDAPGGGGCHFRGVTIITSKTARMDASTPLQLDTIKRTLTYKRGVRCVSSDRPTSEAKEAVAESQTKLTSPIKSRLF